LPLALAASVLGSREMVWLYAGRGHMASAIGMAMGNVLIVAANALDLVLPDHPLGMLGLPALALTAALMALVGIEMRRYEEPGSTVERLALGAFGLVYVGMLLSVLVQLRLWDPKGNADWGMLALVSMIFVVKMCDTGAYTVGRLLGRHKMAPTISPGKTLEGGAGGLAFAVGGSAISFWLVGPLFVPESAGTSAGAVVLYGLAVGVAGMFGDLAESLLKRDLGRKDSSEWMPGFGGVLDILDSLLLAGPAALFLWLVGAVGPK
jgi:phosphatidate cytidylyltransferase